MLLCCLTACGPNYTFNKTYTIDQEAWAYADTLNFEVDIKDTTRIYNLYLEVAHHPENYGFQNLYTKIHTSFPSGNRLGKMVSLELANKAGLWLGQCSGSKCKLTIPIQEGAYFNEAGTYTFTIEQFMRVSPLPGIQSLALKIEDTGQGK